MVADARNPPPPNSTIVLFPSQRYDKPQRERGHLTCAKCSNKTFVAEYLDTVFPAMRCAACGEHHDFIGFTHGRSE